MLKRFTGLFNVWGVLFIVITILIAIFKKEKDNRLEDDHVKLNIVQNYVLLWDILKLPSIRVLAVIMLTAKVNKIIEKMGFFTILFAQIIVQIRVHQVCNDYYDVFKDRIRCDGPRVGFETHRRGRVKRKHYDHTYRNVRG